MTEAVCTSAQYLDALAAFEHATEILASTDPVLLSSPEVLEALSRLEVAARKVPVAQHALVQVAHEQGLPGSLGYTGLKEMLIDRLRLAGTEARDRVAGARGRAIEHLPSGVAQPRFALTMAAQRQGAISERHALVIEQVFRSCPPSVDQPEVLEDILVTAAREVTPEDVAKVGQRAIELLDPDGVEPNPEKARRARGLEIGRQDKNLVSDFGGTLSAECRALMEAVFAKYARPGVHNPDDPDSPAEGATADQLHEAAERDHRSLAQRQHDALTHALRLAVSSGELGQHRGLSCVPIITMGIDQLESEVGVATTATGGRLSITDAIRMAGTNPKYVLLLDLHQRPLFLGREKRLATADQRIALYGSEHGCTAPGCDAPATRTQVHHVTEWQNGGRTDITGLTLACDAHHSKVSPALSGMETVVVPAGDYAGRIGWRRNTTAGPHKVNHNHHAAELYYQALERWHRTREQLRQLWRTHDLREQYEDRIGSTYTDIDALLDSPHGPPLLETLLAEHDADNAWRTRPPGDAPRAA
ncbi:HNH nuclease domain-containing protein OS=Tsukamurella paurometabola (strain ATCC 8368 / DSM/ CCUG 35730 / CIP 100753 / JCM 10117 / KCTC 9821 / NBRC 16120/ NCIMB 702349 / NCTC 13040) OX=521096 GN=Tpau_3745 PE=4 SV=1 [Tsukamurella paurometabola]|uniref:HNH nuclease domain-containing protein n=1 Tax=Tsukamurella paurometabola (strain ATCC 8368 / DSM 20162 / CCUG 35730 / CIP 100753 / JCM 10117 / KCTC 9821 / NBRC 16120 / NCIMB 702349 / NCTC 13040) TaxID=521096 RepID=D5UYM0_TSUPD|nr:HNH endonuclease signature motif containing protein [Tsukamurella paurometabola]ADG80323.1 protein of unknown function DUF222 [Tsukamurella paurometabola DSM 20162]SUP39249.1 Domain of uncharacterised function DUF222 [Tsukamurella paurometabola]